jgi:hypothetical protein
VRNGREGHSVGIQAAPADQEMSESTTAGVMENLPLNAGAQAPRGMRQVLKNHRIVRARWVETKNQAVSQNTHK